jgi:hypothetical protein
LREKRDNNSSLPSLSSVYGLRHSLDRETKNDFRCEE